jgi:hypothetical protein
MGKGALSAFTMFCRVVEKRKGHRFCDVHSARRNLVDGAHLLPEDLFVDATSAGREPEKAH